MFVEFIIANQYIDTKDTLCTRIAHRNIHYLWGIVGDGLDIQIVIGVYIICVYKYLFIKQLCL